MLWLFGVVRPFIARRLWLSSLVKAIFQLDHAEKGVLREFFIHGQDTLRMPIDDPTVAGLQTKGFPQIVGGQGQMSLGRMLFPMRISPDVKRLLSARVLGLPEHEPTEAERERLIDARPAFTRQIERYDWPPNM